MRIPGVPSLYFLVFLLVFLPWIAMRSARRLRAARDGAPGRPLPSRSAIWTGTLASQCLLLALAWWTGRGFGYHLLAAPALTPRHVLITLAALAVSFVLRAVARAVRSPEEKRNMIVYLLAPRTPRERLLWIGTVLVASVAEEAAYRGVGMSILWYSLGNPWVAVLICGMAFALAHAAQGWKSLLVIFAIALVMHGLVYLTGTLVFAMIVHAVYDFVAGERIGREARPYDLEAAANA